MGLFYAVQVPLVVIPYIKQLVCKSVSMFLKCGMVAFDVLIVWYSACVKTC